MTMRYCNDLSTASDKLVLDMYNVDNRKHLQPHTVRLSKPKAVNDTGDGDTTITITPIMPTSLDREVRYFYHRVDIGQFLAGLPVELPKKNYESVADLLDELALRYGINISPREVYNTRIPDDFSMGQTVTLKINTNTSHLYRGELTFTIESGKLDVRIFNCMLNGFEIPREVF